MNRTAAVLALTLTLTWAGPAVGQPNTFDPAVKKLMPKDQLELVERIEALAEQHRTLLFRVKDAKQRGEENERLWAEARGLQEGLVKKIQADGLKDWVGTCTILLPRNAVMLDASKPFILNLKLRDEKPAGGAEAAVDAIKLKDVVRLSTKADPTCKMPREGGKGFAPVMQDIRVESITAVEKVAVSPAPKAARK